LGRRYFGGDNGRRSGKADMHLFPRSAHRPMSRAPSVGTYHVRASAARWRRHSHVANACLDSIQFRDGLWAVVIL